MQSTSARKLSDTTYNLTQFWKALAQAKTRAGTARDWGDLMTLDSQSQWALGILHQAQTVGVLEKANSYDLARKVALFNPITLGFGMASLIRGTKDPIVLRLRDTLGSLGKKAETAFAASKAMALEAQGFYRKANVATHQAGNTVKIATDYQNGAANDAAASQRSLNNITKGPDLPSVSDILTFPIFGIPAWALAAGVGLVAVMVLSAPTIIQAQALRTATR